MSEFEKPSQIPSAATCVLHFALTLLFVSGFMWVADTKARNPRDLPWLSPGMNEHLGAEYNSIAHAIRSGRGFSDPFEEATGPTAWMPPALPYLLAAVYALSGDSQDAAIEFMVVLQCLAVTVTALLVVWQAWKLRMVSVGYAIVVLGLAANFRELFQITHDSSLLLLLVGLLWLGASTIWNGLSSWKPALGWGAFGGLCALFSPVIGAVWAVLTARCLWPHKGGSNRQSLMPLAVAALVSIAMVTPWTVRNRIVLGKWMPIKSNGMYEVWQSQCLDTDGVLDMQTLATHPWQMGNEERVKYKQFGEIEFIENKAREAQQSIRQHPLDFCERIGNRWSAACLYYVPFNSWYALPGNSLPLMFKRLVFPAPLMCAMLILLLRHPPLPAEITTALAIWFLGLLPYILISYYDRYATPIIGMKMLIVLYGLHAVKISACTNVYGLERDTER